MSNWDYRVVELKPNLVGTLKPQMVQEELTKLGRQGWELVTLSQPPMSAAIAVLKKEMP